MSYKYFQISKKSNYAIRALIELAQKSSQQATNVKRLASSQDIPLRFLEIILNELKQGGFVNSTRGKSGGYVLAHEPGSINIGSIIRFLDKHNDQDSPSGDTTPNEQAVDDLVSKLNITISEYFDTITLQDIVDSAQSYDQSSCMNFMI